MPCSSSACVRSAVSPLGLQLAMKGTAGHNRWKNDSPSFIIEATSVPHNLGDFNFSVSFLSSPGPQDFF